MNPTPEPLSDEAFTAQMRRAVRDLPDAPPALLQAARGLWPTSPLAQPGAIAQAADVARAALRLVQAVLSFDSWSTVAVAQGMRSLRSPTRHLLFSAEGRDVDLRISPAAEFFALTGQILGPDESGDIELLSLDRPDATPTQVALDDMGEFRLDGLAAGHYRLTLNLGGDRVELPAIQVGGATGGAAV